MELEFRIKYNYLWKFPLSMTRACQCRNTRRVVKICNQFFENFFEYFRDKNFIPNYLDKSRSQSIAFDYEY